MPRYEFSAWVTVKAETEHAAREKVERAQEYVEGVEVLLSIDDSEPIELDDEHDDE